MPAKPKSQTEGRVQFSAIVARRSTRLAAKDLGVKPTALGHWVTGYARPPAAMRRAIEKRYGIARALWDVPPKAPEGSADPLLATTSHEPDGVDDMDPRAVAAANVKRLRSLLARLDTDKNATMRERASISTSLNAATAMLAKLSGAIEITPSQVMRSPAWARVKTRFVDVLRAWPDALEAVGKALLELVGES
jgi:hypothetical protein